jgi:hypothetical protein
MSRADIFDVAPPIDTRRAARESLSAPYIGEQLRSVLDYFGRQGAKGAIDEELSRDMHLRLNSAGARRFELCARGLVVDSGRRRETTSGRLATVWILAAYRRDSAVQAAFPAGSAVAAGSDDRSTTATGTARVSDSARAVGDLPPLPPRAVATGRGPRCKCGCTEWVAVSIHDGKSTRIDCLGCRRFLRWGVWYGQTQ